jgi:site-specific recombinase XerD
MTQRPTLQQAFDAQIQNLATVLRPTSIQSYRERAKRFLAYIEAEHPGVGKVSQLRRHPHILGWLRSLYEHQPPLANKTRIDAIISVRRLLNDLAAVSRQPSRKTLFERGDLPRPDIYLPKPLSPEDDLRLQQQLQRRNTLRSEALLLMRATGIRVGECLNLVADALRELGPNHWSIHVPLGKLHAERWVPVDDTVRTTFRGILSRRPPMAGPSGLLLLQKNGRAPSYGSMRHELIKAALQAGCSVRPTPHQLRHTYATMMLRAGVTLPVIKQLLGHRSIEMTLRYVEVSQLDLQREYHQARQNMSIAHVIPKISPPPGLPGLNQSIDEVRHRIDMLRRDIRDQTTRRELARLLNRLAKISIELRKIGRLK